MPTYAEIAARLLNDAAQFFLTLGEQNPPLIEQMQENADVFQQMADILVQNPTGDIGGTPNAELAGKLLRDAAVFFTTLADQNAPVREQMLQNAGVFEEIGRRVIENPMGELEG